MDDLTEGRVVEYFSGIDLNVLIMNDTVGDSLQTVLEAYADDMQASDLPQYVKWDIGAVLEAFGSDWMDT